MNSSLNFHLVREMFAAAEIIENFDPAVVEFLAEQVEDTGRLFLAGEGSSLIFPAGQAVAHSMTLDTGLTLHREGACQALDYNLADWVVLGLSNKGDTAETYNLLEALKQSGHTKLYTLSAAPASPIGSLADQAFILTCGQEQAVAATMSVVEQALFCRALVEEAAELMGLKSHKSLGVIGRYRHRLTNSLAFLGSLFRQALEMEIGNDIIAKVAQAETIYFAGPSDGPAEELALKAAEITGKRGVYLPGTSLLHGPEEAMKADDVVIWIRSHITGYGWKVSEFLGKAIGTTVVSLAPEMSPFQLNIRIPEAGNLSGFVELAAGWNLLVEVGLSLGKDLDKTLRARKVGNAVQKN